MGKAVAALNPIRGIRAIMLGDARARGNHREDLDMDIGIYYAADSPTLDFAALNNDACMAAVKQDQYLFSLKSLRRFRVSERNWGVNTSLIY